MVSLTERSQSPAPGDQVELFELDLTPIDPGAGVQRFFPGSKENAAVGAVHWGGVPYYPRPVSITGLEVSGKGQLPRPQVTVGNLFGVMSGLVRAYGTLAGAVLTRYVTFKVHLDGEAEADPNAHYPPDVYVLDRVVRRNSTMIVLECRTRLDLHGLLLPRRQMLRSGCNHTYRVPDGNGGFLPGTCPYVGTGYFTEADAPTTAHNDACSKLLSGCRLRFGRQPLPYQAFPGLGRIT